MRDWQLTQTFVGLFSDEEKVCRERASKTVRHRSMKALWIPRGAVHIYASLKKPSQTLKVT